MKLRIIALVVSMSTLTACATTDQLAQPIGKPKPVNSLATAEMLTHQAGLVVVGPQRNNSDTKAKLFTKPLPRQLSRTKPRSEYARVPGAELIERTVYVPFGFGSVEFLPSPEQRLQLRQLLAVADRVEVRGRTDNRGSSTINESLARKRAEAAKRYLLDRGVPNSIIAVNYQESGDYIADNERIEGRGMNRRVELEFFIDDFTTARGEQ